MGKSICILNFAYFFTDYGYKYKFSYAYIELLIYYKIHYFTQNN